MSDAPGTAADELVDLVLEEPGWGEALPGLDRIAETAARTGLAEAGADPALWQISLLACSDDRIAALNAAFRGREGPTDVLSFPAFAPPLPTPPAGARTHLGDVALALATTRRDAEMSGRPLKDHATHLIIHACLHLLGHDHDTESAADIMEGIEIRALARLGIADPYG